MPTKVEFELAADKFDTAAGLLGELITATVGAGAADILRGGSLGRQVPQRIESAAGEARSCQDRVLWAADLCRARAGVIADYEERLDIYRTAYGYYERAAAGWTAQHTAWFLDTTGTVADPGEQPRPPTKPTPPPAEWADVVHP